ncbi:MULTISPECIES: hypothetical protein [Streptomyces]|uniref:hypothetical protein n=1 Tax=Streptomyces lycopersici TaxID=2974589 RepID=UPI0021CEF36B|nr:hypothetical protein [Streptomyces sp. NEAU-383]
MPTDRPTHACQNSNDKLRAVAGKAMAAVAEKESCRPLSMAICNGHGETATGRV